MTEQFLFNLQDHLEDRQQEHPPLVPDEDYVMEGSNVVFTAAYHLKRGYCCGSGCRNCPYRNDSQK